MSSSNPATGRVDSRLSIADPNSDYSQYLKKQQQQQSRRASTQPELNSVTHQSHTNYPAQLPPPSSNGSTHISSDSSSSSSSGPSTSSSTSSHEQTPEPIRYTLTDNPVRMPLPAPRQPAHRSKLSKQYTPSESEDSDDEPLGLGLAHAPRRSRFMSGQPVELNSNKSSNKNSSSSHSSNATESLRAISRLDTTITQTATKSPATENTVTASLASSTKKRKLDDATHMFVSLAKRISRLFGSSGGSKSSKSSTSPTSITPATLDTTVKKDERSLMSTKNTNQSMETITEEALQPPSPGILHQRSSSVPNIQKAAGYTNTSTDALNAAAHTGHLQHHSMRNSVLMESHPDRKARDSGFEDMDAHSRRRYSNASSAVAPATSHTRLSAPHRIKQRQGSSSSSLVGGDGLYIDQQDQQQHLSTTSLARTKRSPSQPHPAQFMDGGEGNVGRSSPQAGTAVMASVEDPTRSKRLTMADGGVRDLPPHLNNTAIRRSSTPIMVSETLVSRIDREKSTVCFQAPTPRRESYSRDANLDPALSTLVQLHRQDYQTNARLGRTGAQQHQQHQLVSSTLSIDSQLANSGGRPLERGSRSSTPRRDSSGSTSQTGSYSPHYHPLHTGGSGGPLTPSTPHLLDANSRRLSGSHHIQKAGAFYQSGGHQSSFTGSHGNLLYAAANASAKQMQIQMQQPQQLPSPLLTPQGGASVGAVQGQQPAQTRHRMTPQRQSSAGYFTLPHQQQTTNISPFPSPVLGATAMGYGGHELSIAMQHQQHQQQQVQLQIQQQQLQQLQLQQQQQQQQFYQQAVSPLALLQQQPSPALNAAVSTSASTSAPRPEVQEGQQQLDQLQQIRMHQQQLLLQQQQQLQQQLEQTRAVVEASAAQAAAAIAAASLASPQLTPTWTSTSTSTDGMGVTAVAPAVQQQHQAMVNSLPLHYGLPAAPVLTTAMGIGMGMNPSSINMNMMGMGMGMGMGGINTQGYGQLMSSQMTPQWVAYPTSMYAYQHHHQQQLLQQQQHQQHQMQIQQIHQMQQMAAAAPVAGDSVVA
ncbi:hypothetical protein EDD11_008745 [Mortierella claussenii]|nr:hypothetical protein EDD11_008745 [Mortierella claussenii]